MGTPPCTFKRPGVSVNGCEKAFKSQRQKIAGQKNVGQKNIGQKNGKKSITTKYTKAGPVDNRPSTD